MRGVRVVEMSGSIASAYCARLFATAGADVVMVEPPRGGRLRGPTPRLDPAGSGGEGRSALHEYLNAYKRGAALADRDGRLDELFGWADIVVSSVDADPDAAHARHERVMAANPAAVHVVTSGYGLSGPWAAWRSSPLTDWAAGGHLYLTGQPDGPPVQGGGPWDTYLTGATAAVGALAALFEARRSGVGDLVDVGAMEAAWAAHQWSLTMYTHTGVVKRRWGNRLGECHHPIGLFPCADGWVCIGAVSREQWESFCVVVGCVELLADDELYSPAARFDRAAEIDAHLLPWLAERSAIDAVAELQAHRVPASKVLTYAEVLSHPHLAERRAWDRPDHLGDAARMPGPPFRLAGATPSGQRAPAIGEHTDAVVAEARDRPARRGPGADADAIDLRTLRVVEFSVAWAGPLTGRFLADLGADVVKVEHPTSRGLGLGAADQGGETSWTWGTLPGPQIRAGVFPDAEPGERWWNRMGLWNKMNRGKRSLCLDVKAPGGRAVLDRLVAHADVVVNNYSPRGVRSLGIDHATLAEHAPSILTISMSGYGETGPLAEHFSWGPIIEAAAGMDEATGFPDAAPCRLGVAYPDAVGGIHGAFAVLAGLWQRAVCGEGFHIDFSQYEVLLGISGELLLETSVSGSPPPRRGNRAPGVAPQGVYRCAGPDRWVAVTVPDDDAWAQVAPLLGLAAEPELHTVGGRWEQHDRIDAALEAWTAGQEPVEAARRLQELGAAAAPVLSNEDAVHNAQIDARGFLARVDQPDNGRMVYPGFPIHFGTRDVPIQPAPLLGQHNAAIVTELCGCSEDDVRRLREAGTLADAPPA